MVRIAIATLAMTLIAGVANAEPTELTNAQMDIVTAGFGANKDTTPGAKFNGLEDLHHLDIADGGIQNNPSGDNPAIGPLMGVGVPGTVPLSISCGIETGFACAFD